MHTHRILVVSTVLLSILVGCGSQEETQTYDREKSRLRWLLKVRTHALSQGKMLASADDYNRYVQNLDPELRKRVMEGSGVSNVDDLFISERDGKPYVIFYQRPAGVTADVFGYEQTGVDGKRYVAFTLGAMEEVDEQRFAELVPPAARPKK
jgi:hypothetical protein